MNDFDDQVRDALAEAAQPVAPAPDWDDLTRRIARRERRRGAAFALAVVMLVAVIGGTVALQRSRAPRARVASANSAPAGDQVVATHAPLPTLRTGAIGPSTSGFALAQGSIAKGVSAGGARSSGDASGLASSAPMIGPMMPCCVAMYPVRDLAKVFVRSGNGVVVRVYAAKTAEPMWSGPPWWTPPPWCFPTEVVEAEVSTDSA
ncbi:MAG TPA: hypothetical protein VN636_19860, partial [Acidimicrobiia bacterium]|nr:hypothetical protein [Acidimicrobiia bacterium]